MGIKSFSQDTSGTLPRKRLGLLGTYGILLSITLSAGATSFADVLAAEKRSLEQGIETQQRIEAIDDERGELLGAYRLALQQHEDLVKYNDQLRAVVASQRQEAESLRGQLQRVGHLERDIVPLMSDMLAGLEEFVELDVPFLLDQRRQRVERLRDLFTSGSVDNPEKYRRILEAYQIENDYGRTIEAYDGAHPEDGDQVVTYLKIGRVIFLYQHLDGSESRFWDQQERQWIPLERRFNAQISRAIKMAREQIPSDLLLLPVRMPL